jgi:hypothetical protein
MQCEGSWRISAGNRAANRKPLAVTDKLSTLEDQRPARRPTRAERKRLSELQRGRGQHPPFSAGHMKKSDLPCMRSVEQMDCLGRGLQ